MANVQLIVCFLGFLALQTCNPEKQSWNEKTDILLSYFSIGYKTTNSTDIPIMDIISDSMNATSMLLGDITTIKRLSDVVFETKSNGDTRISGIFGLEKFELKMQSARMENYSGPAIIKSNNNSADIAYTIKDPDNNHACRTKWEHFILGEFSDIKVYTPTSSNGDGIDVTGEFNRRILPTLNHYFNTHEFLAKLSKTFDFCTLKRYLFPL